MLSITKAKLLLAGAFMCCLLQFNVLLAQSQVDTTFNTRINYVFNRLEKNRVPYGLLRDYAFEFTNFIAFDGVSMVDSNRVDYTTLGDIYNTLITSRIHTNATGLISPAAWDSLWFNQRQNGTITLSGAFFNYAKFADDAVSSGKITISNDQFVDKYVNGVWQNPYLTRTLLAIAPSTDYYEGKNLKVVLPSNLWFTNRGSTVSSISVDLNDGLGYRVITMGQALNVNYSGTGRKYWKFQLSLTNGSYLYSHASVYIKDDPYNGYDPGSMTAARTGNSDPETLPAFTASKPYLGKAASGWITIDYANADRVLRRPLIVAERFDAGHITRPERWFGNTTMEHFRRDVDNSLSTNLINLLGTNTNDYDIIYVDWRIGTDYIQRNAYLLQDIIDWVNRNKEPLNGVIQPNVIIGQSMGGLITRWALKDMENSGRNHQTRLFISDDSPQQGVNLPLSYQYLYRHANSLYVRTGAFPLVEYVQLIRNNRVSPYRALHITNTPAVRQMFINYVNNNSVVDNTFHNQWQEELSGMGYPGNYGIRVVAVSNGSECAVTQPFSPGSTLLNFSGKATTRFLSDMILSFTSLGNAANLFLAFATGKPAFLLGFVPGRNEIKYQFTANAQPNQSTNLLYRGYISYKKTWLWTIPVQITLTNISKYASSATLPYDYYPGAQETDELDLQSSTLSNWLVKNSVTASHIRTFCFLPVPNALDIGGGKVALTNADYLSRYVGASPPPAPKNTPFRNFITAFNANSPINNEEHLDILQRNGDWIANELNGGQPIANCSFVCGNNMSITGGSSICSSPVLYTLNNAPTGPGITITWAASVDGLVNIAPSSNGTQATVTRSGTGQTGPLILRATIASQDCGAVTINSSTIQVGDPPTVDISYSPNGSCNGSTQTWSLNATSPNTVTSWQWTKDPSSTGSWYIHNPTSPSTMVDVSGGGGGISVTATSSCGTNRNGVTIYSNCGFGITASPNPATDEVTVTTEEFPTMSKARTSTVKNKIYQLELVDKYGNIRKKFSYAAGVTSTKINVSDLVSGTYIIHAYNGKVYGYKQIVVVH